jgi:uncharacterized protein (TIGR02118 family)
MNMTAKLLVLYGTPLDANAFDAYYFEKHVPIAKKIPGLLNYEISKAGVIPVGGAASAQHLAAILTFDSIQAIQAALTSPEGAQAAADLPNFASGGVSLQMFESREI